MSLQPEAFPEPIWDGEERVWLPKIASEPVLSAGPYLGTLRAQLLPGLTFTSHEK